MATLRTAFPILALTLLACGDSSDEGSVQPTTPSAPIVRGAPLDAPVESAPPAEASKDVGAAAGFGKDAIQSVAQGLEGVDLSTIRALGDDVPPTQGRVELVEGGVTRIQWRDLSMDEHPMEDILDKLLYPEDYAEDEFEIPEVIGRFVGHQISIVGYMIPLEWDGTKVPSFMLVGDLLGCCFGGAPQPDQWIQVDMVEGGADYFPYIPVIVTGTFRIEGLEDDAGYAAGCYVIDAASVAKER